MYVIADPEPPTERTAADQQRYATTRAAVARLFAAAEVEFARANTLDTRGPDNPLTALERLELASLCAALSGTFGSAAELWEAYRPRIAIAAAYASTARDLDDASALNTALADLAPATQGDDPFGER